MVAYVFRSATLHNHTARHACHSAANPSSHSPRDAARHLLLHHNRLAELSAGEDQVLANARGHGLRVHRVQAANGRHEMGVEN